MTILSKLKPMLIAGAIGASVIASGYFGPKIYRWERNASRVEAAHESWEDYASKNTVECNPVSDNHFLELVEMSKNLKKKVKSKESIAHLVKPFILPEEYSEDYVGLANSFHTRAYQGTLALHKHHKKIADKYPLGKGESIVERARKDALALRKNKYARKDATPPLGNFNNISVASMMLVSMENRINEAMRNGFIDSYETKFQSGIYFDMQGYDREAEMHMWIEAEGEIMDISSNNRGKKRDGLYRLAFGDEKYLPLFGDTIITNKTQGENSSSNITKFLYIKPKKND